MATKRAINPGNWSDPNIWADNVVPAPEDDVIFEPIYGDIVIGSNVVCKTLDAQNFMGRFVFNEESGCVITEKVYLSQCSGFAIVNPVGKLYCSNPAVSACIDQERKVVVYNDSLSDFIVSYI